MAYADIIRTDNYTREDLATLIDGAIVKSYGFDSDGSVLSTSSTSGVTTNLSVTVTVEAGDVVLVSYTLNGSNASAGSWVRAFVKENGVDATITYSQAAVASDTGGDGALITNTRLLTSPATGTVTYEVFFLRNGGTAYVDDKELQVLVLRAA